MNLFVKNVIQIYCNVMKTFYVHSYYFCLEHGIQNDGIKSFLFLKQILGGKTVKNVQIYLPTTEIWLKKLNIQ